MSWDYLHWCIEWAVVQRMLIDAPTYKKPTKDKKTDDTDGRIKTLVDFSGLKETLKNIPR